MGLGKFGLALQPADDVLGWVEGEEVLEDAYKEFWQEASDHVQRKVRANLQVRTIVSCSSESSNMWLIVADGGVALHMANDRRGRPCLTILK